MDQVILLLVLKSAGAALLVLLAIIGYFLREAHTNIKQQKTELSGDIDKVDNASKERYNSVLRMFDQEEKRRTDMVDRMTVLVDQRMSETKAEISQLRGELWSFIRGRQTPLTSDTL